MPQARLVGYDKLKATKLNKMNKIDTCSKILGSVFISGCGSAAGSLTIHAPQIRGRVCSEVREALKTC